MEYILEVENLTKKYKNGRGVESINFNVNKGDIFGFLGPNGAGKTTIMKIITGLLKKDSGSIKIFNMNLEDNFKNIMKSVGCLIETADNYNYLSAYKNLVLASRYYRVDDMRIEEILKLTGLIKFKNEKVKNFSLGMKQRLGLAVAFLHNPKFVILDEPLNGLDVEGIIEIRNLIKNLKKEFNTTFFISSHLIHDVEFTCNKIGIIYKGKYLGDDYTDNILKSYSSLESYFISEVKNHERN
jgi:ABC-2 type transport system ATP-binding protein